MTNEELKSWLEPVTEIAHEAGQKIMEIYASEFAITPVATRGWLVLFPSLMICATLLALNLVGEGLGARRGRPSG